MLFWDYENISLGTRFSEAALEGVLNHVRQFGRLIEARLYSDSAKLTLKGVSESSAGAAGATLIAGRVTLLATVGCIALLACSERNTGTRGCTSVHTKGGANFFHAGHWSGLLSETNLLDNNNNNILFEVHL